MSGSGSESSVNDQRVASTTQRPNLSKVYLYDICQAQNVHKEHIQVQPIER